MCKHNGFKNCYQFVDSVLILVVVLMMIFVFCSYPTFFHSFIHFVYVCVWFFLRVQTHTRIHNMAMMMMMMIRLKKNTDSLSSFFLFLTYKHHIYTLIYTTFGLVNDWSSCLCLVVVVVVILTCSFQY